MEKIHILYIDDELNNLNSFKAKFRNTYTVNIANNVNEAYEILEKNPTIHIIISDQRMPDMTGVDFFESILYKYPEPIRILLTGYSDIASIIQAINKGQIFRYLEKPWNDYEMEMAIDNAFRFHFINKQLKNTNAELQKRNEELNRFAYSASHDLKAPVKSMLGILKLAKTEPQTVDSLLNFLGDSVKKLDYFINNIIDYYKNTRQEKTLVEIDFNKIIQESIDSIEHAQNTSVKDIDFKIDIAQNTPFINDEFRIYVIISYLLSNAIKYQKTTEENKKIQINIETSERYLKMKITDNGIGIPLKYREHVFKMFFRATTQSTGSGIGLYIVNETIEKINGTIRMNSTEDEGTSFEIDIPNEIKREVMLK